MSLFSNYQRLAVLTLAGLALAGCSAADRVANIGEQPALSAIENPTTQPGYRPVSMPMPEPMVATYSPNSLWRSGSRAFFNDQRASRVGDLVTVQVDITDSAQIANQTARTRSSTEQLGGGAFIGTTLDRIIPSELGATAETIADFDSDSSSNGQGSVNRSERLTTTVAAVVTQVLPNGNMVIEGRQEVRVNFEVRELIVAGVVRPEDIDASNTIESSKIAEARIAYGGRGQITDVQQPRYGQQLFDILMPF
ncbi:flagellar basal body L-ring protein FlgH [Ahrensia marina]|uniref:flagellar basal body L-ring protein FlgH n=1 Tax=Ahrensia marina TaxID=1514904 RepID=UPI0035D06E7E